MKVLFVFRAYGKEKSNSVVDFQRASLIQQGINVDNFYLTKGGAKGYLQTIKKLRELLKTSEYDIIHAHYSFCGFLAKMATKKAVVCSLMGSDIFQQKKSCEWSHISFIRNCGMQLL